MGGRFGKKFKKATNVNTNKKEDLITKIVLFYGNTTINKNYNQVSTLNCKCTLYNLDLNDSICLENMIPYNIDML